MNLTTSIKSLPFVYSGAYKEDSLDPFNSVKINLRAQLDSDLDWSKSKAQAEKMVQKGYQILWDLELGLFSDLPLPLSDTTQFKSLRLSLDHFFETLWKNFENHTIGAVLYKGSLDLSHKWNWDPDQVMNFRNWLLEHFTDAHSFHNQSGIPCQNLLTLDPQALQGHPYGQNLLEFFSLAAAIDYFDLLAAQFPSELLPYLLFDVHSIKSPLHLFQLLDRETLDFIQLGLKNAPILIPHAIGWETQAYANGYIGEKYKGYQPPQVPENLGVLVPKRLLLDPAELEKYESLIQKIQAKGPVRYLSERNLTMDWEGLDTLFVIDVEELTLRKLEGFVAAGGKVVTLNAPVQVSEEISFQEYLKQEVT